MSRKLGFSAFILAAALGACAKKKVAAPLPPAEAPAELAEASTRGKEAVVTPNLETIHFDYDRHELRADARAILARNAEWMKSQPGAEFVVEGHCDSRGTTSYNLALGQKRAFSVRDYYVALGIPSKQLATVSYGEERPVCIEEAEGCWARNRRAPTAILSPGVSREK